MWAYESVFYQIYPLGFCGAPFENDGVAVSRIKKVYDWIPHMKKLGINAIYFSPVFESDTHGYNTRDYRKIDTRLGTNEEFKELVKELHDNGIKVVLDGVFNHAGRGFFAFEDVKANRENSRYKDWFNINFGGNSNYNDGLWYEGWEGNYDLVKLNLRNEEVINYLLESVKYWIEYFEIDGLRLDVAYCLDKDFIKRLRWYTGQLKDEFILIGELLHGDYRDFVNDDMLHSCTNYQCYKGIYSSFNSMNMFEIIHSLQRMFGDEGWCMCTGKNLLSFVDNHDVTRIASVLTNSNHLPLVYALTFAMPGIPCVYYGSEWGAPGRKEDGDPGLRLSYEAPEYNKISEVISTLSEIKKGSKALNYGNFKSEVLTNKQCMFSRQCEGEKVYFAVNADDNSFWINMPSGRYYDMVEKTEVQIDNGFEIKPYEFKFFRL